VLIRRGGVLLGLLALCLALVSVGVPRRTAAQGAAEVWLNVQKGGATKLNIAVPAFTVLASADAAVGRLLAEVTGNDLTYTGLFSVVSGTAALPADNAAALHQALADFAAAGAHAALQGLVSVSRDRADAEMRLYDLTSPEQRLIAQKKFEVAPTQIRRLAHKVADDVALEFTGVLGAADTRLAFVGTSAGRPGKQLYMIDYDGVGLRALTENGAINLSPVWSPDTRSIAFTSYLKGYPDIYRLFPFERRPLQTMAAFLGINTSPAWSPDGRSLALTMSKDGNAEIYVLSVATGAVRRLTWNLGIDAEPTWSPTGQQIAFTSDRQGQPNIFVMDNSGASVRQLTSGGFHTQPRWSPRGDLIAYTARSGTHGIWLVNADGSNPRRLDTGPGDAESASWSPDGRYLAYQANRGGEWQIYTMRADGSNQRLVVSGNATSPSWSPRLP
jgi:TolB protein